MIGGRRVLVDDDAILLPNTRQGRALVELLTGSRPVSGSPIYHPIHRAQVADNARELIALLTGIVASLELPAVTDAGRRLYALGVRGRVLAELINDPWVTYDRIDSWWAKLREGRTLISPVGVMISMLRKHEEPPNPIREADPMRFLSGKWADEIEH